MLWFICISSRFIIEFLHYITCAWYDLCFIYYSCFVTSKSNTGFIKHIFYGDCLFGCLIIYSSQLILTSTIFYEVPFWHLNGPCVPMCRYTILKSNQNLWSKVRMDLGVRIGCEIWLIPLLFGVDSTVWRRDIGRLPR